MSDPVDLTIADLASRQAGYVTRAQLAAGNVSWRATRAREIDGRLIAAGTQTFRLRAIPRTSEGDVMAACLEYGGVASHRTAAWLHGVGDRPRAVDVLVHTRQTQRSRAHAAVDAPATVVHATTSLPSSDVARLGPIPLTSVARTALGLAALVPDELSQDRLEEIIGSAVDQKVASDPWLWWLLTQRRCRGRNGVAALEDVLVKRARLGPTESYLERRVLTVLEEAGLPLPTTQRVIERRGRFVARVDFCYPAERIVLEALGYAHHRTPAQLEADTRRINELVLAGYDAFQFSFRQATGDPASMVRTVTGALVKAGWSPPAGRLVPSAAA